MKKTTIIPTLAIGALLIGSMAFAWPGDGGPGFEKCGGPEDGKGRGMSLEQRQDRKDHHQEFMAVALDLSDDQKVKLEALREKHQQQRQAMREKMRASREDLRNQGQNDEIDEAALRAKARESADLKVDMLISRQQHKEEMLALLTPEQQVKAEQFAKMRDEKRRGHHDDKDRFEGRGHHAKRGFWGGPDSDDQE